MGVYFIFRGNGLVIIWGWILKPACFFRYGGTNIQLNQLLWSHVLENSRAQWRYILGKIMELNGGETSRRHGEKLPGIVHAMTR